MTRERRSSLARVPASKFDVHPSPRLLVAFPSSRPAAVVCGADVFATCSRDKTIRVWREAIGDDGYASGTVCVGHSSFVTTLAYAPPGAIPSLPAGALVSGSRDKRVIVWDPNTGALVAEFAGHDLDVTAVAVLASGAVVSGAMDKRVKIWSLDTRACVRTLEAHESSVLALLPLPSGGFLSGSADHTIRRWEGDGEAGKPAAILRGHSDTVRGLAAAPGVGFLSASHDCTARLWTHGGETATVFVGHTALVYAVAATSDGRVVTGSEDNTSRVWNPADGACLREIRHPGCVWSVAAFAEGSSDIITCCADGVARVWTTNASKANAGAAAALEAAMTAAEEARARATLAEQQSKIKTEPPSALAQPGASDGATKVIEEASGSIAAYAWSAATASWERLGEVTGVGGGGGGKKEHAGVEYDFVFDVDIQEGAPTLKLPFNRGDNPYAAAELFLENNGLDPGYREQVVNFIVQNAGEDAAYQGANVDPFTGGGAYVPGGGGGGGTGGTHSYGGSHDPFTGGGAYAPGGGAPASAPTTALPAGLKYVPMRRCVFFESAKFEPMLKKLGELGASEDELRAFAECASAANGGADAAPHALATLERVLGAWPTENLFPAMDLSRMLALRGVEGETATAMMAACARASNPPTTPGNLLTAGRLFCNAFKHAKVRDVFLLNASQIMVRRFFSFSSSRPRAESLARLFVSPRARLSRARHRSLVQHHAVRIVPGPASPSRDQILPSATSTAFGGFRTLVRIGGRRASRRDERSRAKSRGVRREDRSSRVAQCEHFLQTVVLPIFVSVDEASARRRDVLNAKRARHPRL